MNNLNNENAMCRQVESLARLIRDIYPDLEEQTRSVLTTPEIYMLKKIVLTGSGDCHAAAVAAQNVFEKMLGLPVQVVSPLELSRYYQMKWVGETPGDPLVIALSNSGKAARLLEAVKRTRGCGSMVLAVTADKESPLAGNADKIIGMSVPGFERAPGTRTYMAMLLALYLIAIRMGEVRLKITQEQSGTYRQSLLTMADRLEECMDKWKDAVFSYIERKKDAWGAEFYGSGYDMGSAVYGSEKMYEAAGLLALYSDTENWFHVNYFLRATQRTMTMVFADKDNPAHSRTREMIQRMNEMGRDFLLVTNDGSLKGTVTITLPDPACGLLSPFLSFVPAALAAAYTAALLGEEYSRGFKGIWEETPSSFTTVNSREIIME